MSDIMTDIMTTNGNDEQEVKKSNIGMTVGFSGVYEGRWLKVSASLNYELPLPTTGNEYDAHVFDEAKEKIDELYDFLESSVLEKYIIFCESSKVVDEFS